VLRGIIEEGKSKKVKGKSEEKEKWFPPDFYLFPFTFLLH
jgi:hypothetical protein